MVTVRENTSKDTPRHFTGWMKRAYSWRLNTDWGGRQPHHQESKQNGAGEHTPKRTKSRSQVAEHGEAHEIAPQGGNLTLPRGERK